jgi:hypothetical protein
MYKCKKCGDVFKLPPLEELPNSRITVHREKITGGGVMEAVCSWAGCGRTIFAHNVLPAGWKVIVVARGSLFKTQNLLSADVDGFLCPEHFKELYGLLKLGMIFPQAETAQNEQQTA